MNGKHQVVRRLIVLIFATGVTWATREWPDSLAMENSPYITHVKPPQSYPSAPWFVQPVPSNAKYLGRETPVSSRLVNLIDGRNQETNNPSLNKNGYHVSDLNYKKSVQGPVAPAGRQQWRAATPAGQRRLAE
ncbi:uncharacterized protein LOC124205978 isoform X2 [Daphnia pulex]|uniref:uncharacterized protein LOC124205978 isoform X2 n=1 Tax=Daphnia pulex TaxID=6669 RepID=UPI001EDE4763|nr:uncharacterized protein LOC124205978 isoform X2 [Daphnia pulex]